LLIWVSDVVPGHRHDLTCARAVVLGALFPPPQRGQDP
jgi:hypothetical protein